MERTRKLKASDWCSQARKKGLHASDEMTGVDKNEGVEGVSDEVGKGREVDGRMTQRYTRDGRNKYARVLNCSWFLWLTPTCARKSRWRRQRLALAITHASLCWIKRRANSQWQAPHAHHL